MYVLNMQTKYKKMYRLQLSENVITSMLIQLSHRMTTEEKTALKNKIIKDIEKI